MADNNGLDSEEFSLRPMTAGLGFHKRVTYADKTPSYRQVAAPVSPPSKPHHVASPHRPPGKNYPMYEPMLGERPRVSLTTPASNPWQQPVAIKPTPKTQEVQVEPGYVGLRILSFLLDVVAGAAIALVGLVVAIASGATPDLTKTSAWLNLANFAIGMILGSRICTSAAFGASLGQVTCGIRVLTGAGDQPAARWRVVGRNVGSLVGVLTLGASWLWSIIYRRSFHDWLFNTRIGPWANSLPTDKN